MPTMTRAELMESLRTDPLNIRRIRNSSNTPREAYNCGGFALSIYDWICPYVRTDDSIQKYDLPDGTYTDEEREAIMINLINDNWTEADIEEEILRCDVNFLLDEYPFLAPVELSECDPTETVIAYRIFVRVDEEFGCIEDTDFHFKVRINGFWFEKMGSDPVRPCSLDEDEPWLMSNTDTKYTSRIEYFTIRPAFVNGTFYQVGMTNEA